MIKNGQIWWETLHYRKVPEGQETIYRDNGGDVLMSKEVNAIHGEGSSKLGVTLNLGNFESLRVDVGVSIPCNKGDEATTIDEAYQIAEAKLIEKVQEVKQKF